MVLAIFMPTATICHLCQKISKKSPKPCRVFTHFWHVQYRRPRNAGNKRRRSAMIQKTLSKSHARRGRFNAGGELAKLAVAQRRLVPKAAPQVPGYRLVFAYRPAYIATGDYCDFFSRGNGRLAVFIGDGSG